MSDRELLELIFQKVTSFDGRFDRLESRMDRLESRMDNLEEKVSGLESDVKVLKDDVGLLKETVSRIDRRQEAIFEQTAGLLVFRTEVSSTVQELQDNQRSTFEIMGHHDVQIKTLFRKFEASSL